jgi:hypothetical protein
MFNVFLDQGLLLQKQFGCLKVPMNYKVLVVQQNITLHPWVVFLMTTTKR